MVNAHRLVETQQWFFPQHLLPKGEKSMAKLIKAARKFITGKEEGASMVEYGLLVALIAIFVIIAVALVGTNLKQVFQTVAGSL
jgi:pilus assembly protein Flp/PilA